MRETKTLGVILAGGASTRMGQNKAQAELGGRPLIEHVFDRFSPQVDELIISGSSDFGLGIEAVADCHPELKGPLAGIYASSLWARDNCRNMKALITVPVDAPFLPACLVERLSRESPSLAKTKNRRHPIFANWGDKPHIVLNKFLDTSKKRSILALAEFCRAKEISFEDESGFLNINTPEDLKGAKALLTSF